MPTYLITGVRGGIGLGYIQRLARSAENTIIAVVRDLNGDLTSLQSVVTDPSTTASIHLAECELSSPQSVAALPAQLPPETQIDFIIQNAATLLSEGRNKTALTDTPELMHAHFAANVVGPAQLMQALEPFFAPGARIALITSGIGSLGMLTAGRIKVECPAYSISKTALNMFTVHLAKALEGRALVVCVDPGHVKTEMGGPGARLEVMDSVNGVLSLMEKLTAADSGNFFLYNGQQLPW